MATNLVDVISKQLSGDVIAKIANFLGESPPNTGNAVKLVIPSLLAGLVRKCTNSQEASGLLGLLQEGKHDGGILDNLHASLAGGNVTTALISSGTKLLSSFLGDSGPTVANLIAINSGVSNKSANSLLGLAMPLVLGGLGKVVKNEGINNPAQLISVLSGQSRFLKSLLPAGISKLLSVGALGSTVAANQAAAEGGGFEKNTSLAIVVIVTLRLGSV